MRPLSNRRPLSTEALRDFLKERGPLSLKELMLFFQGNDEEIQYALFLGVQMKTIIYYPPRRKARARWGFNRTTDASTAAPRISPLEQKGELKYDLYSHARLATRFRSQ